MADLITAFWWSYLLYSETTLADEGPGPGSTKQDLVFTSLFAASGFFIGSVGSNFASGNHICETALARAVLPYESPLEARIDGSHHVRGGAIADG